MAALNDSSGGAGSFLGALGGLITRGLSSAVDGELSQKYGLGYFNGVLALDAEGNPRLATTPGKTLSTSEAFATALKNPVALAAIGIGIALLAYVVARK